MADIAWTPIGTFGAVVDCDIAARPGEGRRAELRELLDKHRLLVFEGQQLSYDEQVDVSAWFGKAHREQRASILSPDPELGGLGRKELAFHSDMSCCEPLDAISLHALDVSEGQTSTLYVDAIGAARRLPSQLRDRLRNLTALHLWPTLASSSERARGKWDIPEGWPGAVHPVLMRHPRSNEDVLYLNASQTERIVELDAREGEALILELFEYLYDPAFIYEHVWKNGDLVVWDNLALQHGRRAIPEGVKRSLQRVSVGNDPYGRNMPEEFRAAYGFA
jgi:alpha-ketoglutarate-dependent taurine dioxygenase